MDCRWLSLILLVGISVPFSKSKFAVRRETQHLPANSTFYLIDPSQANEAEETLQKFLSKLVGPIDNDVISGRQMEPSKKVDSLIRAISLAIRRKLMELAREYGLRKTYRQYEKSLFIRRNDLTGNWYSEAMLQGSLLLSDIVAIIDESSTSINRYFQRKNISVPVFIKSTRHLNQSNELQIFARINRQMKFLSNVLECIRSIDQGEKLENRRKLFSLSGLFRNLTTGPPEITIKKFKNYFKNPFPAKLPNKNVNYDQLQSRFCYLATQKKRTQYVKCMEELNHINECLDEPETRVLNSPRVYAKPWLKAVEDLSDCKATVNDERQAIILCPLEKIKKLPSTEKQLGFVYERLVTIQTQWPNSVTKNLAKILRKSEIGRRFINELYQYVRIYEEGRKKVKRLSKMARRNKKYHSTYKRVSKSFQRYRRGILVKMIITVRRMHESIFAFERFVINIDPELRNNWQNYMGVLESIRDWIACLLALMGITDTDDSDIVEIIPDTTAMPESETSEELSQEGREEGEILDNDSWDSGEYYNDYYKTGDLKEFIGTQNPNGLRKSVDKSFGKLLKRMNDASKGRLTKTANSLTSVMNNILLATMFLEAVGLVSALFALNQPTTAEDDCSGNPQQPEIETDEEEEYDHEEYES